MTNRAWWLIVVAYVLLAGGAVAGAVVLDHQDDTLRDTQRKIQANQRELVRQADEDRKLARNLATAVTGVAALECSQAFTDNEGDRDTLRRYAAGLRILPFETAPTCRRVIRRAVRELGGGG